MNKHAITAQPVSSIPPDDPQRTLKLARPNTDESLPHFGLVGDTYTILLSGDDTNDRYCLIDMLIPPGGGPGPHRHDFEESFTVLEGEIEATFRGKKSVVRSGETVKFPPTRPTTSLTVRNKLPGCFASVRRPDKRSSLPRLVLLYPPEQRRHRS